MCSVLISVTPMILHQAEFHTLPLLRMLGWVLIVGVSLTFSLLKDFGLFYMDIKESHPDRKSVV